MNQLIERYEAVAARNEAKAADYFARARAASDKFGGLRDFGCAPPTNRVRGSRWRTRIGPPRQR